MSDVLLETKDLTKHFPITRGIIFQKEVAAVRAVDGVSLTVKRGETLGIVGESGCGKSTLARLLMNLIPVTSGSVRFGGEEISSLSKRAMRARRVQRVTAADVAELARRVFQPARLTAVAVGPVKAKLGAKVRRMLQGFGAS